MKRRVRSGFSLMEVMLATSILLASSIVLVELATIGRKQASNAYDLNVAQLLCQAKLDEIVSGISTATAVEEMEMEDNPGWLYSVEMVPIVDRNLTALKVTIIQVTDENHRPIRFSLVRWIPDRLADNTQPASTDMPTSSTSARDSTSSARDSTSSTRDSASSMRESASSPRQPRLPRESAREATP